MPSRSAYKVRGCTAQVAGARRLWSMSTKTVAIVECLSVKLKLTLGEKLLQKSLQDAVVEPFLGAYKKRAGPLTAEQLTSVEVDGVACDPDTTAGELLTGDTPTVVLHAPTALTEMQAAVASRAADTVDGANLFS